MEMNEEYQRARGFVQNLTFIGIDAAVSVFETNIRIVGGFLTAYALTQDRMYIDKALEIANLLLPAFETPSGLPYSYLNILDGVSIFCIAFANPPIIASFNSNFCYIHILIASYIRI